MRAVRHVLPSADLVYFADQKYCPYGPRPASEIRSLSLRVAAWFHARDARALVVACNTASAAALTDLRAAFPLLPIVGMEPALKTAARATHTGKIAVLATRGTFQGDLFTTTRATHAQTVEVITVHPDDWVDIVERGEINSATTVASARAVIEPLLEAGIDELVLGCTHYPFLAPIIEPLIAGRAQLLDPADAVARQTLKVLTAAGLQNFIGTRGTTTLFTSGDPSALAATLPLLDPTFASFHVHPVPELP